MDEQLVRALVRQAIARHLGPGVQATAPPALSPHPAPPVQFLRAVSPATPASDISHARFHLVRPVGEIDCLIEPAVVCNHCGYCQCYGH